MYDIVVHWLPDVSRIRINDLLLCHFLCCIALPLFFCLENSYSSLRTQTKCSLLSEDFLDLPQAESLTTSFMPPS